MFSKKSFLFALIFIISLSAFSGNRIAVKLTGIAETPPISFAKQELTTLFNKALAESGIQEKHYSFVLRKDNLLKNGAFTVEVSHKRDHSYIQLSGEDEAGISHAVYTFLEDIGYRFEISGIVKPEKFSLENLEEKHQKITPAIRWRGIRQHVNFPMDISSYPVEEAKEYIRNLVRLRFNKLAMHSYPNFWHEVKKNDTTDYAGNFFYAKSVGLKVLRNKYGNVPLDDLPVKESSGDAPPLPIFFK